MRQTAEGREKAVTTTDPQITGDRRFTWADVERWTTAGLLTAAQADRIREDGQENMDELLVNAA